MSFPPETSYPNDPLPYAQSRPGRPGIITAVGIISIVVGALSVLMSLGGIASGAGFLMMSKAVNFPMPAPATPSLPQPSLAALPRPPGVASPTTSPAGSAGSNVSYYSSMHTPAGSTTRPSLASFPFNPFHMDPGPAVLSIIASALSACVAILLLVAGILVLLDRPIAARLHWIYVAVKLPLVALSAYAMWWMYSSMFSAFGVMSPPMANMTRSIDRFAIIEAVVFSSFALIYPIALIIVLSARTAKDYLGQIRG